MKKGFTLLEIITVVIIIAILAIIALPQFFRVVERARAAEAVNVLGIIRGSQLRYYAENEGYSTILSDLDVEISANNGDYKFFNAPNIGVAGQAVMTRSNAGGAIGNYTVRINYDAGDITCSGGAGDTCIKLGF